MIEILFPAFIISLVLLGIHSYFGIRIIRKGIIFTDLAIGQMAAFGAAIALLAFDGRYLYPVSLAFALSAGGLIAVASKKARYLEAVIGLIYALGISGVFILLSKYPHGMEEFQNLMAFDILFTRLADVGRVAVLYAVLGGFIVFYERKTRGWLKEALFFLTFSVTVTSSVQMAGVLVVFAILLSPAYIAILIRERNILPGFMNGYLLLAAWAIGLLVNLAAIVISYRFDFPTGYTLVFLHAFLSIIATFTLRKGDHAAA